jgi:hypothetical protein
MVISNIGTIVLSLPNARVVPSSALSDHATSKQVRILSIANTLSRIVVGPLADLVSPVAIRLPTGTVVYPRKHRVSRVVFLTAPALLLACIFVWMAFGVMSREAVRTLRSVDYSKSKSEYHFKRHSQFWHWSQLRCCLHCSVS